MEDIVQIYQLDEFQEQLIANQQLDLTIVEETQSLMEQGKLIQAQKLLSENKQYLQQDDQLLVTIVKMMIKQNQAISALHFIDNYLDISLHQTMDFLQIYFLELLMPQQGSQTAKNKLTLITDLHIKENIKERINDIQMEQSRGKLDLKKVQDSKQQRILKTFQRKKFIIIYIVIFMIALLSMKY